MIGRLPEQHRHYLPDDGLWCSGRPEVPARELMWAGTADARGGREGRVGDGLLPCHGQR